VPDYQPSPKITSLGGDMPENEQPLPEKPTPTLEEKRVEFERRYARELMRLPQIILNILVWGPNPDRDDPVAKKRRQILELLTEMGHIAIMSEELDPIGSALGLSEREKEYVQASLVEQIFILVERSQGATGELHDFLAYMEIARKIFVFAPERHKDTYSGKTALKDLDDAFGAVYWYTQEELEKCTLLDKVRKRIDGLRRIHARQRGGNYA